jgi:lipopolysaccharide export system permease protein
MRLLDRYLLREFLVPLGYCLGGFLVFWISFELINELSAFQRAQLTPLEVARYFLVTLPELLSRVVPIALLLALLYALNNHSRHHELTAMRVAGLSLWRLSAPYFCVSIACGLCLFCLNEYWMPDSADQADEILQSHLANQSSAAKPHLQKNLSFRNGRAGRTWLIGEYNLLTYEMIRPHVEWKTTNEAVYWLDAERGVLTNGQWTFFDAQVLVYSTNEVLPERRFTNVWAVPEFNETPQEIKSEIKISSFTSFKQARGAQLTLAEILEYLRWHPNDTDKKALLKTKFHVRLSTPWICPVVVLIAIPFGAASGRRNVYVGVASSIFIFFTYFVLQRFGEAAGMGGRLAPWLAGWLPHLLFTATGIWLIRRVR